MQARRPQRLPFQGDIQGIIGENRLFVIVTLVEADAAAVP